MENQTQEPGQAPAHPQQKPKSNKLLYIGAAVGMVIVAIAAFFIIKTVLGNRPTTNIVDKGTHTVATENDLKFGQNRAVNACNVLPVSLYKQVYGPQTGWKLVQEENQIADVANNLINSESGLGGMQCYRSGDDGANNLELRITGFRSAEAAKKFYESKSNLDIKELVSPAPVAGLDATSGASDNDFTVIGVHNNFVYVVKKDGFFKDAPDTEGVAKITTVAKQVVKNMDDTGISTRPSEVPKVTYNGTTLADACQIFSSQLFAEQVIANDKDITDEYAFAKLEAPTGVKRSYIQQQTVPDQPRAAVTGPACSRQNGSRPEAINLSKAESLQRLSNELFLPKVNTTVQISYDDSIEDAQHQLEVQSKNQSQVVSGIGDGAYFSRVGISGELSQLIVRKGTTLVTIQTITDGGSCKGAGTGCPATATDYQPLARALIAKLP